MIKATLWGEADRKTIWRELLTDHPGTIGFLSEKTFFVLCMLSLLNLFFNRLLSMTGAMAIVVLLMNAVIQGVQTIYSKGRQHRFIYLAYLAFALVVGVNVFKDVGMTSLYQAAQNLGLSLFGLSLATMRLEKTVLRRLGRRFEVAFYVLSAILLALAASGRLEVEGSSGIFSPTILKAVYALSFFAILYATRRGWVLLGTTLLFFYVGERTGAAAYFLALIVYILLTSIKNKYLLAALALFFVAVLLVLPYVYVWSSTQPIGREITLLSRRYTGANFYTRNYVWQPVIESLAGSRQWLGLGYQNQVLREAGLTLSTHSLPLYLSLVGGHVMLAAFLLFLYALIKPLFARLEVKENRIYLASLTALALLLTFELLLITNNMAVSVFLWVMLAWGSLQLPEQKPAEARDFGLS